MVDNETKCETKCSTEDLINNLPSNKYLETNADLLKSLADPTRLKIISALSIKELCVNDLAEILKINQTTISHQLKFLKNQYIVESKRDGKIIKYSLQNIFINELMNYAIESLRNNRF